MTSSSQAKALAIAPKISALLSFCGSSYIAFDVIRKGVRSTHSRLLLGMTLCDIITSIAFFMTTWPIPDETNVYGAIGNDFTCTMQGFLSQFSISVPCYNATLTVYYLFYIYFEWSAERIRIRIEPFLHAIALSLAMGTCIMGLALKLYNNDASKCWISPFPRDCKESWKHGGFTNCIRGDNASLYRLVFYYVFVWFSILIVTINMYLVYTAVLKQERLFDEMLAKNFKSEDGTAANSQKEIRHREHSKQVAVQGYWFCGAFYLTWILPTTTRIVQAINGKAPFALLMSHAMVLPLQGFFNLLVYEMPRLKYRFQKNSIAPNPHQMLSVYEDDDDLNESKLDETTEY